MNVPPALVPWSRRLVLLAALLAFLVPALAAPFGNVCLCLHGSTPVAIGACCCDAPAAPACGTDTACSDASACAEDASCGADGCDCVDLSSPGDPFATADRRAEPLPPPQVVAAAMVPPVAHLRDAAAALRLPLPPPEPPASPPRRPRVLRI